MSILCITGGASGLGKAIVETFIAQGRHAIVLARDTTKMQALQDALGRDNVTYYPCDIRDKHALTSIFSQIPEIDCFINNSGIGYRESAVEETLDHIADTIQTNLIGAMRCTNIVLPKMISKKSGAIINICSVAATEVFAHGLSAYSASKAGLGMYGKVVREEVRQHNIQVINVYPGAIKTAIRDPEEIAESGKDMMEPATVAHIIYNAYTDTRAGAVQEEIFIKPSIGNIT